MADQHDHARVFCEHARARGILISPQTLGVILQAANVKFMSLREGEQPAATVKWRYCLASFDGGSCWPNADCTIGYGDLIASYERGSWGHVGCWRESGLAYPPDPPYAPSWSKSKYRF